MQDPQSNILTALYRQQRDDALRLAASAQTLTVWEAAALARDASLVNTAAPDGTIRSGWRRSSATPLRCGCCSAAAPTFMRRHETP